MPRLDLLAEDEGQVGGPGLVVADGGDDVVAECAEELGREGAAVVDVQLERVLGMGGGTRSMPRGRIRACGRRIWGGQPWWLM